MTRAGIRTAVLELLPLRLSRAQNHDYALLTFLLTGQEY